MERVRPCIVVVRLVVQASTVLQPFFFFAMLVLNNEYFLTGTPRRHTRKTSGMYDSDRVSNGMFLKSI